VAVASGGPAFTAVPAPNAIMLLPAHEDPQPARSADNGAVALNAFLDLNASPNSPQQAGVQWPDTNLDAMAARSWPSTDRDARALGLLPAAYVEKVESRSGEQQDPGALPASGQAGEVPVVLPSEGRATSADEPADRANEFVDTDHRSGWTTLMKGFIALNIPLLCTYWAARLYLRLGNGAGSPRKKGPDAEA
jgi:hypothetical protein